MTLQEAETKTYEACIEILMGSISISEADEALFGDVVEAALQVASQWAFQASLSEMIPMLSEGLATYEGSNNNDWIDGSQKNVVEVMRAALFDYLYGFLWRELEYNPDNESAED